MTPANPSESPRLSRLKINAIDDIDYHFNKVKCRKIEGLMPRLMGMVEGEMRSMR